MHFNIILCFWAHLDSCSLFWTHFRGAAIIMSFFLEFFFLGIHVFRFDQFSLLISLFTSVAWITKTTWKMLVLQRMMTLLYEPKIKSYCAVVYICVTV